jgi:hypothetical protein
MKNERFEPRPIRGVAKGAKDFARISDIVLTVVFCYLAARQYEQGGFWFWLWIACAVFCAVAVVRSPIDMMWNAINGRLLGVRKS